MDLRTLAGAPDRFGFQFDTAGWVAIVVAVLVAGLFVYFAARIVIDRASYAASIATILVGNLVAFAIALVVAGLAGLLLAAAGWALVAAFFFRTRWLKGAVIGLVAWALWILVNLAVAFLIRQAPA
jgi:hypothetical protein